MKTKEILRPTEAVHINAESVIRIFRKLIKRISDERRDMSEADVWELIEQMVKEEGLNQMTTMFVMGGHLDLTRFSGHITVTQRGVHNVEERQEIYERVSLPDGTACASGPRDS